MLPMRAMAVEMAYRKRRPGREHEKMCQLPRAGLPSRRLRRAQAKSCQQLPSTPEVNVYSTLSVSYPVEVRPMRTNQTGCYVQEVNGAVE